MYLESYSETPFLQFSSPTHSTLTLGTRSGPFILSVVRPVALARDGPLRPCTPCCRPRPICTDASSPLCGFLPSHPPLSLVSLQPWGGGYGGGGCWSGGSTLSLPLLLLSVPPLQLLLGGEGVRMWVSRGSGTGVAGVRQQAAVSPPLLSSPFLCCFCSSVGEGKEEGEEMEGVTFQS
ncbi:unnamed protein product [Closterium sp. NIES-65]|nr:unnamed protein product [Closterium sp. NIES-65]